MHNKFFKKYYFINKFDKNHLEKLDKSVHIIYRNYKNSVNIKFLKKIRDFCKKNRFKFYLSNNFKLALMLNIDGVYLPSFNKCYRHNCFRFRKNFDVLGSAHNLNEVNIKLKQNVKTIFLAPVFKKKQSKLGIYGFLKIKNLTKTKLVVLGGVQKEKINIIKLLKADGFAAIKYFKKKGPSN